ncbi:MAG: (deoxy)nucleoside triphosphate pyrophosphohydrolase [Ignavibacteria bacterium]|nr:(deoxy)nucleoside triphosphate pyrophosphohydrolase [Ignavibacteria bacterium]
MTCVAVGIIRRDGKILLCQRKRGARYELLWEFPGGKIEEGESLFDCLSRELKEELSIRLHAIDAVETSTAYYEDGGHYEVSYCHITQFDGEPVNNVFEQIAWMRPTDLSALDILEGNRSIVKRLAER